MRIDAMIWLATAVLLLASGLLGLFVIRRGRLWLLLILLAMCLVGDLAGLGWRTWQAAVWPGATAADALAMLAGGALVVTAWIILRPAMPASPQERVAAPAVALIGAGLFVAAATLLAWREPAAADVPLARAWLFGLRGIAASVGLGGWLPALAASALWSVRALSPRPHAETALVQAASPAGDPGRAAALFAFPWLTLVGPIGILWNLAAHATVLQSVAGDLWCVVAWLLGGIYLHATSGWRPRRLPVWLATILAAAVLAAAVLAALSAPTLL